MVNVGRGRPRATNDRESLMVNQCSRTIATSRPAAQQCTAIIALRYNHVAIDFIRQPEFTSSLVPNTYHVSAPRITYSSVLPVDV
jgi:hypothetical protein